MPRFAARQLSAADEFPGAWAGAIAGVAIDIAAINAAAGASRPMLRSIAVRRYRRRITGKLSPPRCRAVLVPVSIALDTWRARDAKEPGRGALRPMPNGRCEQTRELTPSSRGG